MSDPAFNVPTTKLYFEKHDIWIGVYWKLLGYDTKEYRRNWLVLWICFIPCFPLRLVLRYNTDRRTNDE